MTLNTLNRNKTGTGMIRFPMKGEWITEVCAFHWALSRVCRCSVYFLTGKNVEKLRFFHGRKSFDYGHEGELPVASDAGLADHTGGQSAVGRGEVVETGHPHRQMPGGMRADQRQTGLLLESQRHPVGQVRGVGNVGKYRASGAPDHGDRSGYGRQFGQRWSVVTSARAAINLRFFFPCIHIKGE